MSARSLAPSMLAAFAVLACTASDPESAGEGRTPAAPSPVSVFPVRAVEITEPILATGVLMAEKTTQIGPLVDGVLEEIYVEVGDRLRRGDPLLRTRDVDARLRVQERRASVQLAEAEFAKTRLDLERAERLRREAVVSLERLDAARTSYRIAEAKLERSRAELAVAEQALADTLVVAPYGGVVTRRTADEGTFLRAMAVSGAGVLELMKTDRLLAIVHVPELHLRRLRRGTPAVVRVDGVERELRTAVEILNDRVDTSAHTVELRLPLENRDLALKPGLFVKAELRPASRRALVVPRGAVLGTAEERYVLLCEGGVAARRPVVVRDLDAERLEVLSGLAENEQILVGAGLGGIEQGAELGELEPVETTAGAAP